MKFNLDTPAELFTTLLSASLETPDDVRSAIRSEIRGNDGSHLAGLALYFGDRHILRDLAFLLTAEMAAVAGNQANVATLVARVVRNATDIPLWLRHYARAAKPGKRPPRAIRQHLAVLFNRLDEFQFSRSSRETQLALRDALRLLRPKAVDATKKRLFGSILRDQLPVRTTWEQEWHVLCEEKYD